MADTGRSAPRSLRSRTLRSGGLVVAQMLAQQGLRLVSNLIMTRLLVPEAFGLIAFVSTLIVAFNLFSDIGLQQNIIREKDGDTAKFLRVVWVMKLFRGVLIAFCVALMALLLGLWGASFGAEGTIYADPVLPWLVLVAALIPLLQGVESSTKELAMRRLEMGRITVVEIGAQVITILTMVGFASFDPTVWALMAGMLIGNIARSLASHQVYPGPRMRLDWDPGIALRIWRYGKWLLGSSAFTFFARQSDKLILAGLLSSTSFGTYTIALIWVDAGRLILGRVAGQVGFSSIGEVVRDRPDDAPRLFRKIQTAMDGLCVAGFLACFFGGPTFVEMLYTEAYAEAGAKLQILGLILLVTRFDQLNHLIMSIGNSRAMMVISGLRAVALCVSLPLSFNAFGLDGALFSVALAPLISMPYALFVLRTVLGRQIVIDVAWAGGIIAIALVLMRI